MKRLCGVSSHRPNFVLSIRSGAKTLTQTPYRFLKLYLLLSGSPKYFDPLYSFKATVDVSPGYGTVSESVSKTTKSLWNEDILEMIFRYRGTVTGKIKQLLLTTRPLGQQVSRLQCSQNSGENVEKI